MFLAIDYTSEIFRTLRFILEEEKAKLAETLKESTCHTENLVLERRVLCNSELTDGITFYLVPRWKGIASPFRHKWKV